MGHHVLQPSVRQPLARAAAAVPVPARFLAPLMALVPALVSALVLAQLAACAPSPAVQLRRAQEAQARQLMPARLQPPRVFPVADGADGAAAQASGAEAGGASGAAPGGASGAAADDGGGDGGIRRARVRVYASDAHRAQSRRWEQSFRIQLDTANQYLIPAFGIRLDMVEVVPWTRQGTGDDLGAMLAELEARDPGTDVDWVVGLVTALSSTSASFHELGVARALGRHMVLRGHSDLEERALVNEHLDRLNEAERADLLEARKQHRQAVVLLHEWAHTLGGIHETASGTIMSQGYDSQAAGFSPQTLALIRVVLEARMGAAGQDAQPAQARVLRRHLASSTWSGWHADERAALDQLLAGYEAGAQAQQGQAGSGQPAGAAGAEAGAGVSGIPDEARPLYDRARALARGGQVAQAQQELGGLLLAYPAHTELRLAACELALAGEGPGREVPAEPSEQARAHCLRVAALDPGDVRGELALARHHLQAGQGARAGQVLDGALARLPAMGAAAGPAWQALVGMYQGMNAVTWTERAVAAAPPGVDTGPASRWALEVRRRYGLPPRAKRFRIAPDQEGAYLQQVRTVLNQVYAGKHAEARTAARQGLRTFPDAPGLLGALCDLAVRQGQYGAARGHCQRALAGYDEASWAHYLLGIIELRFRRTAAGIRHLQRAIELDAALRQAYHALDKALARRKDAQAQERLRQVYRERFGQAMPR